MATRVIYFIQEECAGMIKIGSSDNPWFRMYSMRTASPGNLRMRALSYGGISEEVSVHKHFSRLRYRAEWYRPEADLEAFISTPTLCMVIDPTDPLPPRTQRIPASLRTPR